MTQSPKRPDPQPRYAQQRQHQNDSGQERQINTQANARQQVTEDIASRMVTKIDKFTSLREYKTRELVEDAEELGKKIARDVKTTQIRKFLDAVNRLKVQPEREKNFTETIKPELELLRPKLAYAMARQQSIKDLRLVMEAAIKKIIAPDDFVRFVQLIESIIAYHKAAEGKDQ